MCNNQTEKQTDSTQLLRCGICGTTEHLFLQPTGFDRPVCVECHVEADEVVFSQVPRQENKELAYSLAFAVVIARRQDQPENAANN
jgi:hypothetical protein